MMLTMTAPKASSAKGLSIGASQMMAIANRMAAKSSAPTA